MNSAGIGWPSLWSRLTRPRSSRPPSRRPRRLERPVDLGDLARRRVDERAEVLPEQLVGRPAGQPPARRVRDEREPGVRADRPDEVRRVLDEVAVAGLGLAEELVQVGVRQGDRGLVGQALEEVELVGQDLARRGVRHRERADHLAGRGPERRRGHGPELEPLGGHVVVRLVRDPRVVGVVVGPDRPDLLGCEAVDPAAERELHPLEPRFGVGVHPAGDDHRHEVGPVVGHPGEVGAVRAEEPSRLLDDAGEELPRIAQRRDPRGDVAQRSLGLGPRLQLALGLLQLVDQAGVEHRDRGLVGERAEEVRLVRAEGSRRRREDRQRPERPALRDERGDRDRPEADLRRDRGVVGVEGEARVAEVVDRVERRPPGDRPPDDVLADPAGLPAPAALGVEAADVAHRDRAADRVEEVDDRPLRAEQPGGLVGDVLEQLAGVADRGDPGGDLAEAPLRLGPPADLALRAVQLLDQPGVRDRDRGLGGERADDAGVVGVEGVRLEE